MENITRIIRYQLINVKLIFKISNFEEFLVIKFFPLYSPYIYSEC